MIEIEIPGYRTLRLEHLVLDYNGTLACDGLLIEGVKERLIALAERLRLHVVTADTFGRAEENLEGIPCELVVLPAEEQDAAKRDYVDRLGMESTACIGNGRNDRAMLEHAELGIAVAQAEGAAVEAMLAAHVVCPDIRAALDLLAHPLRPTATLRS